MAVKSHWRGWWRLRGKTGCSLGKAVLLTLGLIGFAWSSPLTASERDEPDLQAQADKALADGRLREAERIYQDLTRNADDDIASRAWLQFGVCLAEQNRPAEAIRAWENLRRYHPDHELAAESLWLQAHLPRLSGNQKSRLLGELREAYPESRRALALARRSQTADEDEVPEAELVAPREPAELAEWARRMAAMGRTEGVLEQLGTIIDDPLILRRDHKLVVTARLEKARILAHLKREQEATSALLPLTRLDDMPLAVSSALRVAELVDASQGEEVIQALSSLLRRPGLDPGDAEALHWAGCLLHLRVSDAETARRALQAFSARFPESQHLGRAAQLLATVTPVPQELLPQPVAGDSTSRDLEEAASLLNRGRPEVAQQLLERTLRGLPSDDPRNAMGWLLQGRAKARLGDVDGALVFYRQALGRADQTQNPQIQTAARLEAAVILLEQKLEARQALELVRQGLGLAAEKGDANHERLRLLAARACLLLGDPGNAQEFLQPLRVAHAAAQPGPPTELDYLLRAAGVTVVHLSDDPLEPVAPAAPPIVANQLRFADLAFHTGEPRAALQAYERVARTPQLARDLEDYVILQQARCVQRLFRPRDAMRLYQHFHRRGADSPFAPAAKLRLGVLHAGGLGDKAAACREFDELAERHPRAPEAAQALLHLAVLHEVMEDSPAAVMALHRFLRHWPEHPAAEYAGRQLSRMTAVPVPEPEVPADGQAGATAFLPVQP